METKEKTVLNWDARVVEFSDLCDIITERLKGQCDLIDFVEWWDKQLERNHSVINMNEWLSEALLNNYLAYLKITEEIEG